MFNGLPLFLTKGLVPVRDEVNMRKEGGRLSKEIPAGQKLWVLEPLSIVHLDDNLRGGLVELSSHRSGIVPGELNTPDDGPSRKP